MLKNTVIKGGLIGLGLALALGGCSSPTSTPESNNKPEQTQGAEKQAATPQPLPAKSQADFNKPLSEYTKPTDQDWLSYVYISRLKDQPSAEEKMNMFSPQYYNESDNFKKHDLMDKDFPKVSANLEKYKNLNEYVLQTEKPFGMFALLKPYNFETQSFHVENCGQYAYAAPQGISVQINPTPAMCDIKVADKTVASTIESLNAKSRLKMTFTFYLFVDDVDPTRNRINATATHAHVDFQDVQQNDKVIYSVDI